ncbi:MAG: hypothetical protein GEV11_22750 [Streptosporangiales bacterium]|nr:hypothetical protein [Streptosporangiales bacterium]
MAGGGPAVPEEVSLAASHDLSPLGATSPASPALRVPLARTGAAACRLVLGELGKAGIPSTMIHVPTKIVIGASPAPPPN